MLAARATTYRSDTRHRGGLQASPAGRKPAQSRPHLGSRIISRPQAHHLTTSYLRSKVTTLAANSYKITSNQALIHTWKKQSLKRLIRPRFYSTVTSAPNPSQPSATNDKQPEADETQDVIINLKKWKEMGLTERGKLIFRLARAFAGAAFAGTKTLYRNIKKGREIKRQLREGSIALDRKTYRFLRQNSIDIWKVIPILIIWKVPIPFSGSVIPFLVITYPHLLPSTFKFGGSPTFDQLADIVEKKQLEYVKDTPNSAMKSRFANVWEEIKMPLSADKIKEITKVFDGVAQEKLESANLRALLSATSHPAPGGGFLGAWPNGYLKSNWDSHWAHIKEDDRLLLKEGIGQLEFTDLVDACLERGLRVKELTIDQLRDQLTQWLKLVLNTDAQLAYNLLLGAHAFVPVRLFLQSESQASVDQLISDAVK